MDNIITSLVIPYNDNLDLVSHNKDTILTFNIDKLYIQSTDLKTILAVIDAFQTYDIVTTVGDIDKVVTLKGLFYRQRLYVKDFGRVLQLCKKYTIEVDIDKDFRITINSFKDTYSELSNLYKYATLSCLPLDTWLKNCFILQLHTYLASISFTTNIDVKEINTIIAQTSFIDRSPYLKLNNTEYFSIIPDAGYSLKSIKQDKKEGLFA